MKHKKTLGNNRPLFLIFMLFSLFMANGQVEVPFTPRIQDGGNSYINIKGDYTFLANSIINRHQNNGNNANVPYNGNSNNNGFHRDYIDIDGDPTTFSSSSSTLSLPFCSRIYYAGLYWSGNYQQEVLNNHPYSGNQIPGLPWNDTQRLDFTAVKLKVPGGSYIDLVADNAADPVGEEDSIIYDNVNFKDSPYVCYKNVTNELQALADPNGEYFVANVRATRGVSPGGAGGWTLVIVYENPTLPGRYISTFDGYAGVSGSTQADINVSGFNTIPIGNVKARLGASVVEGDRSITGDAFRIQTPLNPGFTSLSNASNPSNNFFNSNITIDGANVTTRDIASTNTLGYDADIFEISNPANSVIENGETSATLRLYTQGDAFGAFLVAFGVEIIEPNIVLEKKVEDIGGNDITGLGVNLGQVIDYVLSFVNTGNDDATNYTIRDVLPINTTLDETNITMPSGTTYVYNPATREITFSIPDNLIEEGDPISEIRMRVQVAENCFDFVDACTDQIQNLAYSTYEGVINDNQISDDPSVSDFDACGFTTPGATNFLLDDLSSCDFSRTVQMCGADVLLDAGDGFDDYVWYEDVNGDGLIDAGDTVLSDGNPDGDLSTMLVNSVGVYIVDKIIADPCKGFQEIITVELFGATQTNPITDLINDTSNTVEGQILVCPNDGEELPEIFLCGLNDTELVSINIPDADSIVWEQLDEASCGAAAADCANKNGSCTWNNVGGGNDFTASDAGQYRVILNYQNGCSSRFYFNIYKNPLDPQFNQTDIICTTPGNITVTNMPVDYEYQLLDATDSSILVPYSANNGPSFTIATNGAYTVEMRQVGVVDGCIFRLENIGVLLRDYQVDITTKDTDCNGLGEISISALNVEAQYYYEISQGGSPVDTFGPSNDNNYTFENLNDGVYDVLVTTDDGCTYSEQVTINDLTDLDLTAVISQHISCREGNIQMNSSGGQTPHTYAIWSYIDEGGATVTSYPTVGDIPASAYQTSVIFDILDPGDYTFVVVDKNNCAAFSNTVTITLVPAVEYTTAVTDETCFGIENGSIVYNMTSTNGYKVDFSLEYSNGTIVTNASGNFTNLPQGDYVVTLTQSKGGSSCDYLESFTIGGPVDGTTGNAVLTQDYTCLQTGTIEVQNVVGGTAPYEYSIDGVNFVSGVGAETFTGLADGTYSITIRDANGCPFVTNSITIDPLNEPTDLTFTSTQPNCPALTSDVTVTVVDGNTPFVFEIIAPSAIAASSTAGNSANFNGLSPNTYTFRVTDNKGCFYDESFTIAPVSPITVVGQLVSNITCFSDTDGEALFTVGDFNTSYDYSITGPSAFSGTGETSTTIPLTGLDDGIYSITVTDNDTNCTNTASVTIAAPPAALTLSATETQPTCVSDGGVVLSTTGGWGSNSFTLTNPDTTIFGTNSTGSFANLTQTGLYSASVTDANGCVVTTTFTLNPAVAPVLAIVPNDICYDSGVGLILTANITSGGDGNYEYSLNGGVFGASNVFSGLAPGTYTVDVRDGKSCTDSQSITINPELTVTASAGNIDACGTTTDVVITAAGGDGNYVYAVVGDGVIPVGGDFGASNSITVTGAGDYDVYIRDKNGGVDFCEANYDINVAQDAPVAISVSNTAILCSGEATSTITITASGGEAPYTYSIDNGATYQPSNTFVNQAAGSYNIRVRDANNCDVTQIYTITEPFTLSASAAVTELVECNPSAGAEIRITNAQGGTAPYEYSFDGGSNYVVSSVGYLLPGTHTVYIRDANGCDFPMTVTVDPQPTAPNATATVDYECDGEGVITVTPDSAGFDYTYEIDGVANTPDTSNIFSDVAVGNHTITVNYISNTPSAPSNLLLESFGFGANTSITQIDPAYCYEPQDGSASLCGFGTDTHIQDGEYSVTQVIANPYGTWQSPNDHTGNTNGRFLAINVGGVAGVGGIVYAKRNIEVIANRDITVSLWAFNLLRNGTSGGDPTIEIQLVDGGGAVIASTATGNVPKNNNANDWHNYTVTLDPGANTNLDIVIRTNSAVVNGNDIAIDDIQAFQTPEPCPGSFDFDVLVEGGNAFAASATSVITTTCDGGSDGSITFEIENFDAVNGFEYSTDGGATFSAPQTSSPITIGGLGAGTHNIIVRDVLDNSCSITVSETITAPTSVVAVASLTVPMTCVDGAVITASASGGTPNYEYQLEDTLGNPIAGYNFATNTTNNVFTVTVAGSYFVRARDTNLCEDLTDSAVVVADPLPVVFTSTPTACYDGNNGEIVVNVSSGNGGYQFRLDGGPWITPTPSSSITHTFSGLTPGSYNIEVKDQYGCPLPLSAQTATIEPQLLATVATTDVSQCADGSIVVTASGGDGSYEYAYVLTGVDPTGSFVASNTFAVTAGNDGIYDVYVRDNSAASPFCEYMETVTVNPVVPLTFTATPNDPECHDGLGSIDINITSGTSPYIVEIIDLDNGGASDQTNTNVFTTTSTFYNLLPGDYTINITDSFGCLVTDTPVTITNPDELTADVSAILPSACSSVDPNDYGFQFSNYPTTLGTIEFSADGGATWTGDNSVPGTTDILTGYISGTNVYPSLRTVDGFGNTICQTDLPRYTIPYPLDDLDITISTVVVACNELQVTVQGTEGVPNYEYAYTEDPANFNPATAGWTAAIPGSYTWVGLIPGRTYVFYVRDSSGCLRQSNVNVNDITINPIEISATFEPSCSGANDAEITYTLSPSAEPQMKWELFDLNTGLIIASSGNVGGGLPANIVPYNTTISISGLSPAEYYIVVTEVDAVNVDACVSGSENLLIEELDPISATLSSPQNITCNQPGLILIDDIVGGSGPFTYTVTGPVPFVTISGTTDNPVEIIPGSPAGTYTVLIEDEFGCSFTDTVDVNLDSRPEISLEVVSNCPDEGEFQLLVTLDAPGIGAPYFLSLNGGAYESITFDGSNQYTITGLSSGAAQSVAVADLNGCPDTDPFTIYPPLEFTAIQTALLDCEGPPNNNAEITIDVTSGSGNYEYEIVGPVNEGRVALPSNPFTWTQASMAGTYSVIVYDVGTPVPYCQKTIDVEAPPAITPIFTHTPTDITCNGSDDGTIAVFATDNGINPLTYTISPVAGSFNATTNTFEGLPPGTYAVTALGTNNCTTTITGIVINEPAIISTINTTVLEFGCSAGNNPNNASIAIDDAAITGGSGTYVIYEFINDQGTVGTGDDVVVQSGPNTAYIETNTAGGTYIINVYDDRGCIGTTNATILPYDELLSATASITNPLSCTPGTDGEITITVTSTNSDPSRFEYSDDNGATYQASNVFPGLDVGTHNFLIRHIDTGCIITVSETLTNPNTFTIDVVKIQDVICFGTQTGEITLELVDATYVGAFNWIIWNTNGTADTADDTLVDNDTFPTNGPTAPIALFAGDYLVEVLQNGFPQCTNFEAFTISQPSAAITGDTNVTDVTCALNDGVIEVIDAQGGWGGYTYFVDLATNPAPTFPGSYQASPLFTGLAGGVGPAGTDYQVWVADVNGCVEQLPNVNLVDPDPINASLQVNQENCTNLQGEIEVVGTIGGQGSNYIYQLIKDGVAFGASQSSTTFSGLGAGSYEVLITDQWSCSFTTAAELLYEEMNLVSTVVKAIDCTVAPGGEITITVTGGSSNLDYTVTFPDATTTINNATGIFTGLTQDGTYTFVVNDLDTTNPVCSKTIMEVLDAPTPVTFDAPTRTHVSCNGGADGEVTINLTPASLGVNDNPVYTYTLYDAIGTTIVQPTQTSPTFTGLSAAFYQVEVVSSRGCLDRQTFEITEPAILTASATATAFACNASNTVSTSTITAIAGGGTAPYLYSIDGANFQSAATFEVIDNGSVQNITVTVVDANNCSIPAIVAPIQPLNVFTAVVSQDTAISCANPEEILISVTDNGNGLNAYTYELLPIGNPDGALTGTPTNVTATFNLTAVGNYTFRVTDTSTGCYFDTAPYEILPYDLIDVVATATMPVTCFSGTNDGAFEINITGYAGAYSYEIFNGSGITTGITGVGNTTTNPMTVSGLSGGNYFVRIFETNNPLCQEDSNVFTIISPDMPLTATVDPIADATCTDDQGEIIVSPSGGYAPYDIVLTNTTTSQIYTANGVVSHIFTGLSAGNFTVDITDAGGCTINDTEVLVPAIPITADISATLASLVCYGDTNASVTAINVINGQGVYQYQLNYYDPTGTVIDFSSGTQTSPVFDNLGAGIYSITVSDGWNCGVETVQVTITEPVDVFSSLVQLSQMTCNNQAQIQLFAAGGTGPYEFSVDGTSYAPMSGGNSHTFTVSDGVYQYYVRDSFGCDAMQSNQISIEPVPVLTIDIDDSAATINCTGEATATILATATGGLGNYSYELYSDAALTNLVSGPQATGLFSNLIAGSYFVHVTSVDCEETSAEIIIIDPLPLQIDFEDYTDVACNGANDGTITVEVSGGTGEILYAISPTLNQFDTENVFTDLEPGDYDVIAQDENGCFIVFRFTISEPNPLDVTYAALPEVCAGNEDGSISVTIIGGTAPYSTAFNSNNDADFVQDQTLFTDLAAGTYVIFVRDAQGCETNIVAEIEPGVNLNGVATPIYTCSADMPTASIDLLFEDPSVSSDVMYALDSTDPMDLQLDYDFGDIAPGNHTLTISHSNGCINTIDFIIEAFDPLTLVLEQNNINEITAIATGGTQNYTFTFDGINNGDENTYYITRTDTFTVTVTDENGCMVSAEIFVEFIDIEIPNFFTPDGDGNNDFWVPQNIEQFPQILTIIFDRYGREVYRMELNDSGWDGIYQNTELPTGDYWYIIKLMGENDDREFVGHFTLYR